MVGAQARSLASEATATARATAIADGSPGTVHRSTANATCTSESVFDAFVDLSENYTAASAHPLSIP